MNKDDGNLHLDSLKSGDITLDVGDEVVYYNMFNDEIHIRSGTILDFIKRPIDDKYLVSIGTDDGKGFYLIPDSQIIVINDNIFKNYSYIFNDIFNSNCDRFRYTYKYGFRRFMSDVIELVG
jgi:hypothetical protein